MRILALFAAALLWGAPANAGPSPVIWGTPAAKLLTKDLKFGTSDTTTTCNAAAAGNIRYNAGTFQGCNGSAWYSMNSEDAVSTPVQVFYRGTIDGGSQALGTTTDATAHEITNASWTLSDVASSTISSVSIMCSGTNASSGATCAAGSESAGVSFTVPADHGGYYEVCFDFANTGNVGSDGNILNTFRVVRTATNAQTILAQGGAAAFNYFSGAGSSFVNSNPNHVCGIFGSLTASTTYGFRLFNELTASGTITSNDLQGTGAFGVLITVTIKKL